MGGETDVLLESYRLVVLENGMSSKQFWYVTRGGQSLGPFTSQQLKEMASRGQIQPTDLIWTEGLTEWVAAGSSVDLFPPSAEPQHVVQNVAVNQEVSQQLAKERRNLDRINALRICAICTQAIWAIELFVIIPAFADSPDNSGPAGRFVFFLMLLGNFAALWGIIFLMTFRQVLLKVRLKSADELWKSGHRDLAVSRYKQLITDIAESEGFVTRSRQFWKVDAPRLFRNLIEYAVTTRNLDEARELIEQAVHFGVAVTLSTPEGVTLWNQVVAQYKRGFR